jgi:hypothetical protein
MNSFQQDASAATSGKRVIFLAAVSIAIALSIICCTLVLLVPTASITVDTVYQGF